MSDSTPTYQVRDEQLTDGERQLLNCALFPLLRKMKLKARVRLTERKEAFDA